jgi:hypothetical protein
MNFEIHIVVHCIALLSFIVHFHILNPLLLWAGHGSANGNLHTNKVFWGDHLPAQVT